MACFLAAFAIGAFIGQVVRTSVTATFLSPGSDVMFFLSVQRCHQEEAALTFLQSGLLRTRMMIHLLFSICESYPPVDTERNPRDVAKSL